MTIFGSLGSRLSLLCAAGSLACLLACVSLAPPSGAQTPAAPSRPSRTDPVALAATIDKSAKQILLDFESGEKSLAQGVRSSSQANSTATYRVAPVPEGGYALHALIPNFKEWDNIGLSFKRPFSAGHTLTCFRAKGGPQTRELLVEWRESDGTRWLAVVNLSTHWKEYALAPEAFRAWEPPQGRNGPGDHLRVENANHFTVGIAVTHTDLPAGLHEFWFDDLATASAAAPVVTARGIVTTVVDAQTLLVRGVGNVRLMGVTPLRDPSRKPKPDDDLFGDEADRATRRLVAGHRVRIEIEGTGPAARPGGVVPAAAWVFLQDGTLLNEQLVRRGYARVGTLPKESRYGERLRAAEQEARAGRRGIWPKLSAPAAKPPAVGRKP
jgi:endonuclease YncB( thermonuclease family)